MGFALIWLVTVGYMEKTCIAIIPMPQRSLILKLKEAEINILRRREALIDLKYYFHIEFFSYFLCNVGSFIPKKLT